MFTVVGCLHTSSSSWYCGILPGDPLGSDLWFREGFTKTGRRKQGRARSLYHGRKLGLSGTVVVQILILGRRHRPAGMSAGFVSSARKTGKGVARDDTCGRRDPLTRRIALWRCLIDAVVAGRDPGWLLSGLLFFFYSFSFFSFVFFFFLPPFSSRWRPNREWGGGSCLRFISDRILGGPRFLAGD